MVLNFGFGDFIFKDKKDNEIQKATNIEELIKAIETVPIESIIYHGKSNHFSNWLAARSEFSLATKLRKINVNEFKNKEKIREKSKNYRIKNKEKIREMKKKYYYEGGGKENSKQWA